jgi:hypothetical protein
MKEEFLGRKEGWRYTYTVTGTWPFPLDMLRYDDAQGATAADRALIERLSQDNADSLDDLKRKSRITLVGKSRPTPARWRSFLWTVEGYDD